MTVKKGKLMSDENLVVIGAGPGGYTAAFLAADLGMKVTLVDADARLGGVCLRRGCIPSKALLHIAKLIAETRHAKAWGLDFGEPRIDLAAVRDWKEQVVRQMTGGLAALCKQRKVTVVTGRAVFKDSHTLAISGKDELTFDHAILAVGSSPAIPKEFAGCRSARVMDSTGALEIPDVPERLLVVGGGYIGLEMGTVYAALGSRVTVVEFTDGLLPGVDRDLVRPLQARLNKDFEGIFLNSRAISVADGERDIKVAFEGDITPGERVFDRVLVAAGRRPNTAGIGLENTRVEMDERGFIRVDKRMKTADPALSAIGDAVGGAMLAHKAFREGRVAVEALAGGTAEFSNPVIPAVVFTDPEIAWCGLTETEARSSGREIAVARFPWGASGRAATLGRAEGMTKLIVEPQTEEVLGVAMVGAGAGELIAEGVLAVEMGARAEDLASAMHPHPTLSETVMEAAEVFFGKATHFYRKK